jgi:hypothetical protein
LKEPVLRRHESLGKKQIVLILSVNVGDAPAVTQHSYGLL